MERVSIHEVDPSSLGGGVLRYGLTEPLGAADVAINRYRVPPGEGLPAGLHAHMDQEELFVVISGTATFETLDGEVTVASGEAIRFGPGEFQSGRNGGADELVMLALGAPSGSEEIRIPANCPDCGFGSLEIVADGAVVRLVCPDCDAAHRSSVCPACGHDDLRVTLGDGRETVVVCEGCSARFDEPPLED